MFRKSAKKLRVEPAPPAPAANDSKISALEDRYAPMPVPEVVEDDSDAAWNLWLAASRNVSVEDAQTALMDLRPEEDVEPGSAFRQDP